ncbi:hypothetical protein SCHPADRAFT_944670 [Schizopora paradoxa]|uniref:Uncharacterized protein n=1 Tax=Schizopora paradoxa TaxID=27342 RepID=A0A0H2R8I8_9AGAM|nr:hypothetical protein SCHPADRAFT_944670 [Schizopora paradoxa]
MRTRNFATRPASEVARRAIISTLKISSSGNGTKGSEAFHWPFSPSGHITSILVEDVDYEELKVDLRVAEAVDELLQRMVASASAAVKVLKTRFNDMANRRKFRALPDEILAMVFEMIYKSHSSDRDQLEAVKNLSLVSRRFRHIVIGLPVLWSNIPFMWLHVNKAKLFASRSITPIISLSIYSSFGRGPKESEHARVLSMYQLAVSISSRIRKMDIWITDQDLAYLQQIGRTCSNISLPFLFDLTVTCHSEVTRKCRNLCYDWIMPSLRKLRVNNVLPHLSSDVLSKIDECSIEANYSTDILRTEEIVEFLLSLTAVKVLCVTVRLFDFYERSNRSAKMDSVERLTLELQNSRVALGQNILHFIEFPSLKSFNLDLGLKDLSDLDDALENVNFKVQPKSVTDVTLGVGIEYEFYDEAMPTYLIGEWSQNFVGLKTLTLESKRKKTHGLFAFSTSVDAIKIIGCEEEEGLTGDQMAYVPGMRCFRRPHRIAVIRAKNISLVNFSDGCGSDSDDD